VEGTVRSGPAAVSDRSDSQTAVDVLNDRVLPFYDELGVDVDHLLTDNGREYCGRPLSHPFELYLTIQQIEHRRTDIGSPQTNGFCERFHRTVKEEFFSVTFRKTFYESVAQLQADLDKYLVFYNRERAHQGYRTKGRTPYQTLLDGIAEMRDAEVGQDAA
jgi:transposase InsO family protein